MMSSRNRRVSKGKAKEIAEPHEGAVTVVCDRHIPKQKAQL
ncbi:unnamed protein product [Brassica rapa subsp. trilocularis]